MTTPTLIRLTLIPIVLAPLGLAEATTYYVAKSGSNSHSCSQAQSPSTPKLTIAAGLSCVKSRDTLIIKAGAYSESIDVGTIPSGTQSGRTTIKAAPGEAVIIKATGNSIGDAISIYDRSYITLDGLTVEGRRYRVGGNGNGPYSHNITFQNGKIRNVGMSCTATQGPAGRNSRINFINNEISNCKGGHGLYIHARDSLIERNRISNAGHLGIQLYHMSNPKAANNNVIRYNEIFSNGTFGILVSSGIGNLTHDNLVHHNQVGGIMVGYETSNNEVRNNKIYDNNGDCIWIRTSASKTVVKNNACWENSRNRILNEGTNTTLLTNVFTASKSGDAALTTSGTIPSAPVDLEVTH
jgi:parallel beta-helix repeat protein